MDQNAYNLVCKYCEVEMRFANFDDFLEHARSSHGPHIGVSAISIVPEAVTSPCTRVNSAAMLKAENNEDGEQANTSCRKPSHLSFAQHDDHRLAPLNLGNTTTAITIDCNPSEPVTSCLCSRAQTPFTLHAVSSTSTSVSAAQPTFDLSNLQRPCLMELITLLSKCICIWHKPSRKSMSRKDRFHAYQLLLCKLREFEPEAKFRDIRNIVRQLITNFFHQINGGNEEDDDETEDSREKEDELGRVREQEQESEREKGKKKKKQQEKEREREREQRREENALNPTTSKTVMERLLFLTHAEKPDVKQLDLSKLCSFCNMLFWSPEALFTHMLNNHLPDRKAAHSSKQPSSCHLESSQILQGDGDTSEPNEPAPSSKSQATSHNNTDLETDYTTDHSEWEQRSQVRRRRRKSKSVNLNARQPHAKRQRRMRDRDVISCADTDTSNGETDISIGDTKSSRYFLNDYDDNFLEEFIELYRQHECLWHKNSEASRNRKLKSEAYNALAAKYRHARNVPTVSWNKIKALITRLRGYYDRMRKPKANPYRRHIWQRLAFIDEGRRRPKTPGDVTLAPSMTASCTAAIDCQQCSKRFKRSSNLSTHVLRMHPPTSCSQCDQQFGSADDLKKHVLQQHQTDAECPICRSATADWKSPQHLAEHFYDHICPSCSLIFHDGQIFQQHKQDCRSKSRYRCDHCAASFTGIREFRLHSRESHQEYHPFKCETCAKRYKFLAPLMRHQRWHKRMQKS